jgi:hypothetical protein
MNIKTLPESVRRYQAPAMGGGPPLSAGRPQIQRRWLKIGRAGAALPTSIIYNSSHVPV